MTSEALQNALEQNHENLKELLNALGANYEISKDPEKKARAGAFFGEKAAAEDIDMTEEDRLAWMFEENTKAIAAAAEAAGVPKRKLNTDTTDPLKQISGHFVPDSEAKRAAQKREIRGSKEDN